MTAQEALNKLQDRRWTFPQISKLLFSEYGIEAENSHLSRIKSGERNANADLASALVKLEKKLRGM